AKLGTFGVAVYRRRGNDTDAWVAYTEEQSRGQSHEQARWVQRQLEDTKSVVALRASSMLMHVEAIRAGAGRGVLPCYIGDGHPLLERLTAPIPELAATYWMIVHRDIRRAPCVRAVIDWMKALLPSSGTSSPVSCRSAAAIYDVAVVPNEALCDLSHEFE